jgi:DNA-directed RNA polymerase subunit RPC12/RpoP
MLLTPTCNLKDNAGGWIDYWLFAPLQAISSVEGVDPKIFFSTSAGFKNSFGIRADPFGSFPDSFIDFNNIVSVPSMPFQDRALRIKTLGKAAYNHLLDKTVNFLGATWGYAVNEPVEKNGQYRCIRCTRYSGLTINDKSLEKGSLPGECENCGARASWVLLETFKRKKI